MPSYNTISYPGHPYAQTHPDRLATVATMYGVTAPPPDNCRVLEIGCGDGSNLIPMAATMPGSSFLGIDLADSSIEEGAHTIAELGLANIQLSAENVLYAGSGWGKFDYIICHGVFSWVAPRVQDKILELSSRHLSTNGVLYISYDALPGSKIREAIREILLFARYGIGAEDDPELSFARVNALLHFMADGPRNLNTYNETVQKERARALESGAAALIHERLTNDYAPTYLHHFLKRAEAFGFQFLAEADFFDLEQKRLTPDATKFLNAIAGDNRVLREQYAGFATGRAFGQTLLCRNDVQIDQALQVDRITALRVSTGATLTTQGEYNAPTGSRLITSHAETLRLMTVLVAESPQSVPVSTLGIDPEVILATTLHGITDLHTNSYPLTARPSLTPEASPLIRHQIRHKLPLTTLTHNRLVLEDPEDYDLLLLLDGTRSQDALSSSKDLQLKLLRLSRLGLLIR